MINLFNLCILLGLMIPNIIYALSVKDIKPVKREKTETWGQPSEKTKKERTAIEEMLLAEDEEERKATETEKEKAQKNFADEAKKKARWKRLNLLLNVAEQFGRYACMILMIVPFGVLEFGFSNVENFIIYVGGNAVLLISYWIVWFFFLKKRTFKRAVALAILPTCVFLLTGLTLDHWWLVWAALVFGICHTGITVESVWED